MTHLDDPLVLAAFLVGLAICAAAGMVHVLLKERP